jgi:hypothetical protein
MSIIHLTTEEFSEQITAYYQKYNKLIEKRIEGKVGQNIKIITRDPTHRTLTGNLEFSEDGNEKTLSFVLISENKIYTETIFIPISISLQESQKIIQMEIEKINSDILELLEYGETRDINLEHLKKLKSLSEMINRIKNEQTQRLLLEKNMLLQEELALLKKDGQLLSELKQHPNQQTKNQYFANHLKLDHTVKKGEKQLVVPGSTVRLIKDGTEQEISMVKSRNEMHVNTGQQITLNDIQFEPGLRFKIKHLKQEEDIVSYEIIKQVLQSHPDLLTILHRLLSLPESDIHRPGLSYSLIQKDKEGDVAAAAKVDPIKYIETPFVKLLPFQYDPDNIIRLGSSTSECSNELLFGKIEDVEVDDFTFRSIVHYQAASQFYNRRDMDENMRQQNNQLFIRFSREYTGSDSLYNLPVSQLADLSLFTSLKKSVVWNVDFDDNTPSPASLSLRKALYAKQKQNATFRECLIKTGNAALYRKKARNIYKLVPELMEVRQFAINREEPPYESFNYDPNIKRAFEANLLLGTEQMARKQQLEENIQEDMLQIRAEEQEIEIQKLKKQIDDQEKQRIAAYRRAIYSQKYISSPIQLHTINSLFTAILQNITDQERSNVARGGISPQDLATSISQVYANQYPNDAQTILSLENMINTNTHLQLKLLSQYFCARIEVVSSAGIDTYAYDDDETNPEDCPNLKALFSLGRLDGFKQPLFFSLVPDLSQRDECIEYLWDTGSNMLLRELPNDEQEYIGLWDPIEISINKTQEMPEMDPDTELTVEILPLCKINDRIYYKSTQVIFK